MSLLVFWIVVLGAILLVTKWATVPYDTTKYLKSQQTHRKSVTRENTNDHDRMPGQDG